MKQASTRLYFARISCALGTVLLCRAMDSGHMTTCVAESGDMIGEDGAVLLILLQHCFVQNQLLRTELRKNMFGHRFAFLVLLQLNHGMGLPCKAHNLVAFPFIRMYATNSLRKIFDFNKRLVDSLQEARHILSCSVCNQYPAA